jgi:2-polyprenyl-3-methyl-5-hydroxy-6-metoxy-1,4-benzoquinol methylase
MTPVADDLLSHRVKAAELSRGISSNVIYAAIERVIAARHLHGAVLDYGAGVGDLTRRLVELDRFSSVSAADIMPRPPGLDGVQWIEQDLNEPLPGHEAAFDVVIAAEVIEHLENPRFTVRELFRLVRPGGTIIVTTPNNESWRSLIALIVRGHYAGFGETAYPAHITALLRKDLTRIFQETGLWPPQFAFTHSGGIPGKPNVTWQKISFGLLRGLRFSDNLLAVAVRPGGPSIQPAQNPVPLVEQSGAVTAPAEDRKKRRSLLLSERIRAIRSRRMQLRLFKKEGLLEAAARYIERNGLTVRHGPFAGTIYPREAALSRHSIPKLLGTYEQELHEVLDEISRRTYDLVIDIGSAEGYYAVGLARLLKTRVLAYDPEPVERKLCAKAARLNGVETRVELKDLFRPSDIRQFSGRRVLCICDCEGFEAEIFTPQTIRDAARWDLLIELHGSAEAKLMSLEWPQKTKVISTAPHVGTFPEIEGLGDPDKLISDYRGGRQRWLWCDGESLVVA